MVRPFLIAGLLIASAASAQTIALTPTGVSSTSIRFNASACGNDLQVTWTSTLVALPCGALQLWSTESECGDVPLGTDVRYTDVPQATVFATKTGSFTLQLNALPAFKYSDAGVVCGSDHIERAQKICGSYQVSGFNGACTVNHAQSLAVIYDTLPPVAPVIDSFSEQDTAVKLNFTVGTDAIRVHFEARTAAEADFTERSSVVVSTGNNATITHLVDGTAYQIRARAEDSAGNISEPSEFITATPRHTSGFFTQYRKDGGDEQGGCSAIAGLPIALAAGLWLMRRKGN